MLHWPQPQTIKALRGFLGLIGYYRRFIRDYGKICQPLNLLLKRDAFGWSEEAESAFHQLKTALSLALVLTLADYTKPFVLECDASGKGVGAILMQEGRPLAFYSKALSITRLGLFTYEKKLFAVVMSVTKWRHYQLGRKFLIKTDHQSLKFLLEQRVTTPMQQKWLSKLMGFDYDIVYKTRKTNVVVDALPRMGEGFESKAANQGTMASMTVVLYQWVKDLSIMQVQWEGILEGKLRTYQRLKQAFFWKGMKQAVLQYVAGCDICQRHKNETVDSPGLLQPLPIPARLWSDISMDFIEGLPSSTSKIVIYVVVDRLRKYDDFMSLPHPYSTTTVAQVFLDNIFKLHVAVADNMLQDRSTILKLLKEHLVSSQHRMKQIADQHRSERVFEVGDWVYLKLQPFRQVTVAFRRNAKLAPKYFGPYQVVKKLRLVAYELELPPYSKIHPVFHVSLLKKKLGQYDVVQTELPLVREVGQMQLEPVAILDRRLVKQHNRPVTKVWIQWSNSIPEDATWESTWHDIQQRFPLFQP
ncbi:hypothetical protein RHSIM_Rhsim01G0082100 [Rhododendron simsii]|uniref:Uncharacterized protein n=1 Tax=Rhododendron simsii TaxID=118357 RepID=A0A834HFZ1_RHOSS|nr:hypothetical protein RHSIM_Rhsim01G0082100 [Rhododendron simsii]